MISYGKIDFQSGQLWHKPKHKVLAATPLFFKAKRIQQGLQ